MVFIQQCHNTSQTEVFNPSDQCLPSLYYIGVNKFIYSCYILPIVKVSTFYSFSNKILSQYFSNRISFARTNTTGELHYTEY